MFLFYLSCSILHLISVLTIVRFLFLLYIFITSCSHKNDPQPSDTLFKDSQKNWIDIYANELQIALDNDDTEAFYFFWEEYKKELNKIGVDPNIVILE